MTRQQFKEARLALGFSTAGLAKEWGMGKDGGRAVRRWESGERPVNPIAIYAIKLMLQNRSP